MTAPYNPYLGTLDDDQSEAAGALRGALFVATKRPASERWARVTALADRTQLPTDVVDRNFDTVAHAVTPAPSTYDQILTDTPGLAHWLTDPDNATLGKDELGPLARVDRGARLLAPQPPQDTRGLIRSSGQAVTTGYHDLEAAAGQIAAAYGLASPSAAAAFVAGANARAAALRSRAPAFVTSYDSAQARAAQRDAMLNTLAAAAGPSAQGVGTVGALLDEILTVATHPRGFAYHAIESLPSFAPALAAGTGGAELGAAAGTVVPGVGNVVGGIAGLASGTFLGTAPVNVGSDINAELQRRGVDVTDPAALEAAYRDPEIMRAVRGAAERRGLTTAAINALVAPFAGRLAAEARAAGAPFTTLAKATATDVGIQAAGQTAAELGGQVAGAKGDLSKVDLHQALQSGVEALGFTLGQEAIGASLRLRHHADPAEAAVEVAQHAHDALGTQRDVQALAEIGQAVKEAKTTASVPDRIRQLVDVASGGEDAASIFFQSGEWDRYWQQHGESPAKAAADLLGDGGRAYDEAKATGAPMRVPLGDYVAKVAPTEHFDGLLPIARTQPDGMSLGEAHEYLQSLPATMHELATEAASEESSATPASAQQIEQQIAEQLKAAKVPGSAKLNAQVVGSFFRTMAQRLGIDPAALFARYAPSVRRGEAPATEPSTATHEQPAFRGTAPINEREQMATYDLGNGDEAYVQYAVDGSQLRIGFIGSTGGKGSVDAHVRAIGRDLAERTGAAEIAGQRISGARPGREAVVSVEHLQDTEAGPRGRIRIGTEGATIELLPSADRSTFLHETGHLYLHILDTEGAPADAPAELATDRATIRQWLGAEGDAPLTSDQHEQFARAFEAYLMEGQAPSAQLRGAFSRFRTWLTKLYRTVRALNVQLTPDVRGVFDRMLATQDEIAQAEYAGHAQPLFDDPRAVGMSEEQAAAYTGAVAAARSAAEDELAAPLIRQMRREESAEWKALREPVRAHVEQEVNADPVYQALSLLTKGTKPDGSPLVEGTLQFKLDRDQIVRDFGEHALEQLPRGIAVKAFGSEHQFVLHPDVAAELLGFGSGRELLAALAHAPSRMEMIERLTDLRMQEQHGERVTDATLRERAIAAVRNEKRVQLLRKELEYLASEHLAQFKGLTRAMTRRIPPTEAVQAEAQRIIGGKAVRDVRPFTFEVAARRAATESREAFLRGDLDAAFEAKQRELLATEVFRAATEARTTIDGALRGFRAVFRADKRLVGSRDMDLVNAARALLSTFGIGRSDDSAFAYLRKIRQYDPETADGLEAVIENALSAIGSRGTADYRTLTVQQFSALREAVDALWTKSRRNQQMEIDGVKQERAAIVTALVQHLEPRLPTGEQPGQRRAVTKGERNRAQLFSAAAALRRAEHWIREMDNGRDDGPFRTYILNPIIEAETQYRLRKSAEIERHRADVHAVGPTITHAEIPAPELGYTFQGKNELLGALLHAGNESNLSKLLRGRGWGTVDETGALNRVRWDAFVDRMRREGVLTKTDYDFAQRVWDHFESLKPEAQRSFHELYGYYFDEVTAAPIPTPWGAYRGGYYPAKVDPFLAPAHERLADAESLLGEANAYTYPSTGLGFTKSRVEAYARPLIMDASQVPLHLDSELRLIYLQPHVVDVAKLLRNRDFADALESVDRDAVREVLDPWLRRVAQQKMSQQAQSKAGRAINDAAGWLRRRASMQILAGSLNTAAEQLTHMPALKTRVSASYIAHGLWEMTRAPKETVAWVREHSDYMTSRETAGFMEARQAIRNVLLDPSTIQRGSQWVRDHALFLSRGIQMVEDHVAWTGAYSEAVAGGMDERAAVRHADAIVREIMGAYEPSALSTFEAGHDLQRLFSMFAGFFLTKANMLKTDAAVILRDETGFTGKATKLAGLYTFGFMLPAVLAVAIKNAVNGQPIVDEDGDGTDWLDVFRLFFGSQFELGARMLPIVGPAAQYAVEHLAGGRPTDVVSSPALSMLQSALRAPGDVKRALEDRLTHSEITDIFTLLGLVTGTPARPLAKPIGYLHDVSTGEVEPAGPIDATRGFFSGQ